MSKSIPEKPDFAAIEAISHTTADRRTMIMALIGNLAFSWSNTESMFIYVLMGLLDSDQTSAAIVFATLNTTRARLELIQRLAKSKPLDKSVLKELDRIIDRFNECTKVRNEFNHCTYTMNERGDITHTQVLRIREVRGRVQLGAVRKMDDARFREMLAVIRELKQLNRDLWDFVKRLKDAVDAAPNVAAKGRTTKRT